MCYIVMAGSIELSVGMVGQHNGCDSVTMVTHNLLFSQLVLQCMKHLYWNEEGVPVLMLVLNVHFGNVAMQMCNASFNLYKEEQNNCVLIFLFKNGKAAGLHAIPSAMAVESWWLLCTIYIAMIYKIQIPRVRARMGQKHNTLAGMCF